MDSFWIVEAILCRYIYKESENGFYNLIISIKIVQSIAANSTAQANAQVEAVSTATYCRSCTILPHFPNVHKFHCPNSVGNQIRHVHHISQSGPKIVWLPMDKAVCVNRAFVSPTCR